MAVLQTAANSLIFGSGLQRLNDFGFVSALGHWLMPNIADVAAALL
jgi:hypothetical protein